MPTDRAAVLMAVKRWLWTLTHHRQIAAEYDATRDAFADYVDWAEAELAAIRAAGMEGDDAD